MAVVYSRDVGIGLIYIKDVYIMTQAERVWLHIFGGTGKDTGGIDILRNHHNKGETLPCPKQYSSL
jgi:hypothetical protein